jgi:PAS domain S-box-containing protein
MMAKSLGASVEKLIGKNIFDILPKEIAEERAKIARIALKDGKNQETDDERAGRYFHNIYVPVLHPDGTKTIQTIVRDITEKKKTEDALLESEEKYRILFNDVPVGIGITDKNGRVVDCNQYMAEMFGMTCEEFKTINTKSLYVNPENREHFQNLLNIEGRVVDWESTFKRKDGTVFSAILNADIIDRDGQKLNLTTLRDITERKVAEEKIRKQNVQLKKLDGVKTDFLNTTSHELRTPVSSIKGYIQMLLKHTLGDITEEQKKALEVVLRNTNRLDSLIQDILDISRLESGTMKFIPEKTDVMKMINEVAETMQTSADVKRIKINSDIQKEIPDLMIDSERIKQVLINLVDNAIKFSPDDSMILIKAKKEKGEVVFEVQDFGRGIPKNKQNKIFDRFYQVDSGTDRKFGGIGLGLTISKKIIDTNGGQIWVDSIVGKGSSFKFSLPLQSSKDIKDDLEKIPLELP